MTGEAQLVLDGSLLQLSYTSSFQGKPLGGQFTLAYSTIDQQQQLVWIDSFHNAGRIMYLGGPAGTAATAGFSVSGTYPADAHQYWGWRITVEQQDQQLRINHFNIPPNEPEMLGVTMLLLLDNEP